ncbi:MAG TPA: DUF3089 domain-containing protein [Chitinophagaceae bacterium]|nr:DUF3089 domain-containing protein [Chitinophagaceae bacterium]
MKDQIMKEFDIIWLPLLFMVFCFFSSCSDKYRPFVSHYQFKSRDNKPDYARLDYWAAHPLKWDPSDSIPKPFRKEKRDSLVDVFFLHPTMYTGKLIDNSLNANVDDPYLNAKTDYSSILYQASVFNQHARIYAPRFREANYSAYFFKDSLAAVAAFDLAYQDVRTAFEYYLGNFNNGRPIIIASHSQGTTHALRLLKEFFEGKPLQNQLVAAYVVGMMIPPDYFSSLKMCEDPYETGCFCGWRTFRKGYKAPYVETENEFSLVTNPLTWKTNNEYAPKKMNKGSILYKFNKAYKQTTDAQIHEGVIWVKRPRFPWSFLYSTKNYHVGDINLYYLSIRENAHLRIDNYFRQRNSK